MRRADNRRGPVAPPAVWGTAGSVPIQPDRLPHRCHRGMEHRRNTVGLPAKANSGLLSRPTTSVGLVTSGFHEVVIVCVHQLRVVATRCVGSLGRVRRCDLREPGTRTPGGAGSRGIGAFGRRTTPMKFLVSSSQEGGGRGP